MNILVVDATHLYRDILQQALSHYADVRVELALSQQEARELVARETFHFFVISGQLPDGDGIELAKTLRSEGKAKVEPIVLLTSSASSGMAAQAVLSGVTELFRKQDIDELLRFMRHYVELLQPMRCRILYVEDARDQRALLETQLRAWGMTVDAFASADEAWLAFEANDYDLVLCDVVLGGHMTGTRLINRIRRLPLPKGGTPVLAVTAFDNPLRRIELFQLGVDDYVQKPILAEEIRARLHNLLSRKRAVERSEMLLAATALGVVVVGPDGIIVSMDDNSVEMFRPRTQTMRGQPLSVLLPEERNPDLLGQLMQRVMAGERISGLKAMGLNGEGEYFPVELTMVEISSGDGVRHFALLARDITEEQALATYLTRASEAAERAEQMKTAFLANMSHEIRTPLNAVIGMAHVLSRTDLDDAQKKYVGHIDAAGQHLLGLITNVLDLSKIEAGRLELESIPVAVENIVCEVLSMIADQAAEKGLEVRIGELDSPSGLVGDPVRLRQALLNYVSNAIKFTAEGSIDVRVVAQEVSDDAALLRFEVADTGIGISAAAMDEIFSAFRQADNSTTRRYGGSGLGLAITRQVAELMGGEAGVSSTLGEGSLFWFTVLLKRGATLAARQVTPLPSTESAEVVLARDYAGFRCLLVEDEIVNRQVAEAILTRINCEIDTANDGREAIDMARRNDYALILMDMLMPNMGGLEAAQGIRLLPGCEKVPIIALTANAFAYEKQRCLDAGMNDFVSKPIRPEVLFETMLRCLAG
ncbi:MAG: hypothetical protein H6R13_255 [Proteobacteria bacterium]|nr:hypothetical protein [Pseudomonadota bacterium]